MSIHGTLWAASKRLKTKLRIATASVSRTVRAEAPADKIKQPFASDRLHTIRVEREAIHAEFDRTARLGFPPEALIFKLHANHLDEIAEERRQLSDLERGLQASLRRLDAMFPEPPPPEPEPPVLPRARHYPRMSSMFGQRHADTRR